MQPNAPVPLPDYNQQPQPQYGPPGPQLPPASQGRPPLAPNPYGQPLTPPPTPLQQPRLPKGGGGHVPWLLISFILTILLLMGAAGFGAWAYFSRQDYKYNSDKKAAAAAEVAKQQESVTKEKEFAEREKSPYKNYKTPATYGSVSITYPKTWAAFVTESKQSSGTPVNGYFHPNFVPGIDSGTGFALRLEVVAQPYANQLKTYEGQTKNGKVRVAPYKAPKMPDITGARVEGEVVNGQQGVMVLFPLRDKTIKISTLSTQFTGDLDKIILANLTFEP
jgi:hypothetical protein